MAKRLLSLVLLLTFLGPVAFAQPIYEWTDEKGQRHFSNFPPAGVTVKKHVESNATAESIPTTSDAEPGASPPAGGKSEDEPVAKLPNAGSSNESLVGSDRKWLLVLPPRTRPKVDNRGPFSGWIPRESFDGDEACNRAKAILIGLSWVSDWIDPQIKNSVCIPATKFVTGKDADVIIAAQQFEIASPGFSSVLLVGKVFNRGEATARNVVATYRIRSALGSVIMHGDIATSPSEIPGLAFGEFRTPSIAGWSSNELVEQIEVDWARK